MKKTGWVLILSVLALVGVGYWLLQGTDPDNVQRRETVIDVEDVFEK